MEDLFGMNQVTAFLKSFAWSTPDTITWLDKSGYIAIDADRRAIITITTRSTVDHYVGFDVAIVSKTRGKLDCHFFHFDDYLDIKAAGQSNPQHVAKTFSVITYIGWEWHLATPSSTMPLTDAIEQYIALFN